MNASSIADEEVESLGRRLIMKNNKFNDG